VASRLLTGIKLPILDAVMLWPWIWKPLVWKAEALPEAELVHVCVDGDVEHAVIFAVLIEPAAVDEGLAVVGGADADAAFGKGRAQAAKARPGRPEARPQALLWDPIVGHVAISPCHARHCREAGGKHAAECNCPQT
jgi:hypothetical protein